MVFFCKVTKFLRFSAVNSQGFQYGIPEFFNFYLSQPQKARELLRSYENFVRCHLKVSRLQNCCSSQKQCLQFGGLDIYIYLCVHNLHYTEFYIIINVITIIIVIIKSVE